MPARFCLSVLLLLATVSGCTAPKPDLHGDRPPDSASKDFGRPVVLARGDGEARMLQGRKPIWLKIDPQTVGSRSLTVGTEDMPPGDSIGIHKHLLEDEVVYIARGKVTVTLGDSTYPGETGGLVFIPRGTWIGFRVDGPDTASIVFVFNTPGFEHCLRAFSSPVGSAFVPPSPTAVAAARHACHQIRQSEDSLGQPVHKQAPN